MFHKRNMEFSVRHLRVIRPIQALLPSSVSFQGAYSTRDGVEAPHSFTYVTRAGGGLSVHQRCLLLVQAAWRKKLFLQHLAVERC